MHPGGGPGPPTGHRTGCNPGPRHARAQGLCRPVCRVHSNALAVPSLVAHPTAGDKFSSVGPHGVPCTRGLCVCRESLPGLTHGPHQSHLQEARAACGPLSLFLHSQRRLPAARFGQTGGPCAWKRANMGAMGSRGRGGPVSPELLPTAHLWWARQELLPVLKITCCVQDQTARCPARSRAEQRGR